MKRVLIPIDIFTQLAVITKRESEEMLAEARRLRIHGDPDPMTVDFMLRLSQLQYERERILGICLEESKDLSFCAGANGENHG